MQKIYGTKIKINGKTENEFTHWYSNNKETSDSMTECAKAMPPPEGVTVEFTPVESDVICLVRGTYELDNGKRVLLNHLSGIIMHGYAIVGGKSRMTKPVAFYLNGEPSSRAAKAKGARITKLLSAYAG